MEIRPGGGAAPGASADADGTHFTLFSANAQAVDLCIFDRASGAQIARLAMPECVDGAWRGFVPGLRPGACYGYRVHGPYDPQSGARFNGHKLLLDPYARQLHGAFQWHESHFAYLRDGSRDQDLSFSALDNSAFMPKAVVMPSDEPLGTDTPRRLLPCEGLIYEVHVRGITRSHPQVPAAERGCFAGMARAVLIDHLRALGVTSVQLLPVQAFIDEYALHQRGLSNYWGYNTLAFFAPHPAYLSGSDIYEFRRMVETYHEAGIEVLLDVVYNHSCEGDELGPTLSLRGIDNQSYYRLRETLPRYYVNDTGCGNTLNIDHPQVLKLVVDSLLYWVDVMGVDGFRFDLAPVLGRNAEGFSRDAAFFRALSENPRLAGCKLIAEPWDVGPGGYQLGGFPHPWSEWNDRYRDSVRRFWRGDPGELPELARRLHGSADIFEASGRPPSAGVNYVASHDGFTISDLVSFSQRHNRANGEDNRDGHRENFSSNNGCEGPTDEPAINEARAQQQRNLLATLALSPGLIMLQAGDEMGRTTQGNNNPYCQDNAISWVTWTPLGHRQSELLRFARRVFALRRALPLLHSDGFRHEHCDAPEGCMLWFAETGEPMQDSQWEEGDRQCVAYVMRQKRDDLRTEEMLVAVNGGAEDCHFTLPPSVVGAHGRWWCALDTAHSFAAQTQGHCESNVAQQGSGSSQRQDRPPDVDRAAESDGATGKGPRAVINCLMKARSLQVFLPAAAGLHS